MAHVSAVGSRVLAEIEEASLDQVLASFRQQFRDSIAKDQDVAAQDSHATASRPRTTARQGRGLKHFPIPSLDQLVARHFRATQSAPLVVGGRHLPLIYLLVATLIASPQEMAVVVVDLERRFDVTRVFECTPFITDQNIAAGEGPGSTSGPRDAAVPPQLQPQPVMSTNADPAAVVSSRVTVSDLAHLHIFRPAHGSQAHLSEVVASAGDFMLYGQHGSHGREWWGTIVVGGSGAGEDVDVTAAWNGWLRVDRQELAGQAIGLSAEEALRERERRQEAVDNTAWLASSVWGNFSFDEN